MARPNPAALPTARKAAPLRPREDHGFFGPDSVCWKVWSHPFTPLVAIQRGIVIEMFEPVSVAGVSQYSKVKVDPVGRSRRTTLYFLTTVFGDGRAATEAADRLRRLHDTIRGIEPISGRPYCANDAEAQLWVLMTGWHSLLYCYERFGGGRLTPEEVDRYWAECALAGELQMIAPLQVPRNREAVRAYFAAMRPKLCVSEATRDLINTFFYPPLPAELGALRPLIPLLNRLTIATMPGYLREMAAIRQPAWVDELALRLGHFGIQHTQALLNPLQRLSNVLAADGYAVRDLAMQGPAPICNTTVTPAEAWAAHAARQAAKRGARTGSDAA